MDRAEPAEPKKAIRIFIGSHTLRMHGADILLSRNLMTLYGSDRDKLSIPFVRPEDDAVFKHLTTTNTMPSRPKLNAAAPEFVTGENSGRGSVQDAKEQGASAARSVGSSSEGVISPTAPSSQPTKATETSTATSESGGVESDKQPAEAGAPQPPAKEAHGTTESHRREVSAVIRTSWRQTAAGLGEGSAPLSGYQPAARPRGMKVLRPNKGSSSTTRTGAAFDQASGPRSNADQRRKAQGEGGPAAISWGSAKRSVSGPGLSNSTGEGKQGAGAAATNQEPPTGPAAPRTANNPLGSASAFSWIASNKPKAPATAAD
jgi:hypothetical protein